MNITLTDEQVKTLVEGEITKRLEERNKELVLLQAQLQEALNKVNAIVAGEVVNVKKKEKLTDEKFIQLWNEGKTNAEISRETGKNQSQLSTQKKRLVEAGKIEDRKK